MDIKGLYGNFFQLDGTNQLQRLPMALEQGYILPDERATHELLEYAKKVSSFLKYYNQQNQVVGDWQGIFKLFENPDTGEILNFESIQALVESKQDWPAHIALFFVFIKLYETLKNDINRLPERHLKHFYESALGVRRASAQGDEVHALFELTKRSEGVLLPAGTALDGGVDVNSNSLIYETANDIYVNNSSIQHIYRLTRDRDKTGKSRFYIAKNIADQEGESWYTFGAPQLDLAENMKFMEEANLGFMLTSPLLNLAEGKRDISIVMPLEHEDADNLSSRVLTYAFDVYISGESDWIHPDFSRVEIVRQTNGDLTFNVTIGLDESSEPMIGVNNELHEGINENGFAAVKLVLKGDSGLYHYLNQFEVTSVDFAVEVSGLKNLVLQTNQSVVDVNNPVALFGSQPRIGSSFYIGSKEALSKPLNSCTLSFDWVSKPELLKEHYHGYIVDETYDVLSRRAFEDSFQFDLDLLSERKWINQAYDEVLFPLGAHFNLSFNVSGLSYNDFSNISINTFDSVKPESYRSNSKNGFFRMVLKAPTYANEGSALAPFYAFGHSAFATNYSIKAIEAGTATDRSDVVLPAPPYTPTIENMELNYSSSSTLSFNRDSHDQFFVLDAFGQNKAGVDVKARIVPVIDAEASLFIGIQDLAPPGLVSFLFEMQKGTVTSPEGAIAANDITWHILANDRWLKVPRRDVLIENTLSFQKPGIISINIGQEASLTHQMMPSGLLWLRVDIHRSTDSVCKTNGIHEHAVLAKLKVNTADIDNYTSHLTRGLPAQSITKLKTKNRHIKKISQPYSSFNGKVAQSNRDYFQAVNERLRHRNRAISPWDIERTILNRFPSVFKVKCLSHTDEDGNQKAGELAVVIIPNLRSESSFDPFEPRADTVLMREIERYLKNLVPFFSRVHVIHPVYENIRVDARIAFKQGFDPGYYLGVLNDEISRYLSPWAYEDGQDIIFNARIYRSDILAFIEDRPYVDFVTEFNIFHVFDGKSQNGIGDVRINFDFLLEPDPKPAIGEMTLGENFIVGRGVDIVATSQPHAILVSHKHHHIESLSMDEISCPGVETLGIGYMTIGLDFEI